MKKLAPLSLALSMFAMAAYAQLPLNHNASTSDVTKVTGNFDTFSWKWLGHTSQTNDFFVKSGSTWVDLDAVNVGYKISRNTNTGLVTYVNSTNVTITDSNVTFNVANTNIPPNGTYLFELYSWTGATTNQSASLAQGKVKVNQSLYQEGDASYPWPAAQFVEQIVAGVGVTISPATGVGVVTINGGQYTNIFAGAGTTGAVTSAAGDAGKFLKADGTWATPTDDQTLAEVLAQGNLSDGYDMILSAHGLDQSRRLGFAVNDGLATTTNYLDSIADGEIRYDGVRLVDKTYGDTLYEPIISGTPITNLTYSGNLIGSSSGAVRDISGASLLARDGSTEMAGDLDTGGNDIVSDDPFSLATAGTNRLTIASDTITAAVDLNLAGNSVTNVGDLVVTNDVSIGGDAEFSGNCKLLSSFDTGDNVTMYMGADRNYAFQYRGDADELFRFWALDSDGLGNPAAVFEVSDGTSDLNLVGNSITNCADPVNAQDVVTKAYGDANYLGGGGTITGVVRQIFADSQPSMFAAQPDTFQLTNTAISTTHIMAGFDKDTRELFGADIAYLPGNANSNATVRFNYHTAGSTNVTFSPFFWYSDGNASWATTGSLVTIPPSSLTNQAQWSLDVTLSNVEAGDRIYWSAGIASTNEAGTRDGTIYVEAISCEFFTQ